MGLTFNLGRVSPSVFTDSSLNVGIGAAPSGTYKLEVTGTAKVSSTLLVSGALTFANGGANYLYGGALRVLYSNGTNTNNIYSGGVNGLRVINQADNAILLSIADTGAATFSSTVTTLASTTNGFIAQTTANSVYPYFRWVANNRSYWAAAIDNGTDAPFSIGNGNTVGSSVLFTLTPSNNSATFSGTIAATSATFSGNVGITGTSATVLTLNGSAGSTAGMMINASSSSRAGIVFYQQATVDKWQMGMSSGASPTFDLYTQGALANAISFAYATGAATFSSTVRASGAMNMNTVDAVYNGSGASTTIFTITTEINSHYMVVGHDPNSTGIYAAAIVIVNGTGNIANVINLGNAGGLSWTGSFSTIQMVNSAASANGRSSLTRMR